MTDSAIQIIHQNIHQRQSIGQLVEPAPNTDQLELAFQAALTAQIIIDLSQRIL